MSATSEHASSVRVDNGDYKENKPPLIPNPLVAHPSGRVSKENAPSAMETKRRLLLPPLSPVGRKTIHDLKDNGNIGVSGRDHADVTGVEHTSNSTNSSSISTSTLSSINTSISTSSASNVRSSVTINGSSPIALASKPTVAQPEHVLRYGETVESLFCLTDTSDVQHKTLCHDICLNDKSNDALAWRVALQFSLESTFASSDGTSDIGKRLILLHRRATSRFKLSKERESAEKDEVLKMWLFYALALLKFGDLNDAIQTYKHIQRQLFTSSSSEFYTGLVKSQPKRQFKEEDMGTVMVLLLEKLDSDVPPMELLNYQISLLTEKGKAKTLAEAPIRLVQLPSLSLTTQPQGEGIRQHSEVNGNSTDLKERPKCKDKPLLLSLNKPASDGAFDSLDEKRNPDYLGAQSKISKPNRLPLPSLSSLNQPDSIDQHQSLESEGDATTLRARPRNNQDSKSSLISMNRSVKFPNKENMSDNHQPIIPKKKIEFTDSKELQKAELESKPPASSANTSLAIKEKCKSGSALEEYRSKRSKRFATSTSIAGKIATSDFPLKQSTSQDDDIRAKSEARKRTRADSLGAMAIRKAGAVRPPIVKGRLRDENDDSAVAGANKRRQLESVAPANDLSVKSQPFGRGNASSPNANKERPDGKIVSFAADSTNKKTHFQDISPIDQGNSASIKNMDLEYLLNWDPSKKEHHDRDGAKVEMAVANNKNLLVEKEATSNRTSRVPKKPAIQKITRNDLGYMMNWDPFANRQDKDNFNSNGDGPDRESNRKNEAMMMSRIEEGTESSLTEAGVESSVRMSTSSKENKEVDYSAGERSKESFESFFSGDSFCDHPSGNDESSQKSSNPQNISPAQYESSFLPLIEKDNIIRVNNEPYAKLSVIGKGGSCKVYRVLSGDGSVVAIKKVKLEGCNKAAVDGYANEIALLKRLRNNPAIIKLHDSEVDFEKKTLLLVMEVGEVDLNVVLRQQELNSIGRSSLNMNFIRLTWQQMLKAVHAIHEERIVHSDLKPANFMFVRGALKLIDFGIAKAIERDDTTNIYRENLSGTISYMSPEAIMDTGTSADGVHGHKCGRASDIWSLGCILYQMIYGKTPFADFPNMAQKIMAITNDKYEIVFPGDVDASAVDAMRICLERDPKKRATIVGKNGLLSEHCFLHSKS